MEGERLWKVEAICLTCGRQWETRPKKDAEPPRRCHKNSDGQGCGSTETMVNKAYKKQIDPDTGETYWEIRQDNSGEQHNPYRR